MKICTVPLFLLLGLTVQAQYYYNDIIGTLEINQQMETWQINKVKSVSASGYDNHGLKAGNFSEYCEIAQNGSASVQTRLNGLTKSITINRYNNKLQVTSTEDSLSDISNVTFYEYNALGKVSRIRNTVKDSSNDFNQVETHDWFYAADGKPEKMWRIIENTGASSGLDSMEVRFTTDSDGNIAEERTYKKGIETNFLYYYYDDKNRLSDIVRYNTKLKKLVPEIMFEHDGHDRVIQKITTTSDRVVGYLIWRYLFNEQGLKTKEALFDNNKQLTGKIEYTYRFYE